jgi:hypothetical protein
MKHRHYFAAAIGILATGIFFGLPISDPPAQCLPDWERYQSAPMGFSIEHPAGWEVSPERPDEGGLRVDFKSGDQNVWFSVTRGADIDFGESIAAEEKIARKASDATAKQLLLDNQPANYISYVRYWQRAEQTVKTINIYQESRGLWIAITIYNYTPAAEDDYSAVVDEMIASFKVIDE